MYALDERSPLNWRSHLYVERERFLEQGRIGDVVNIFLIFQPFLDDANIDENLSSSFKPRTSRPVKHIINVDVVSRLSVHGVVTYDDGTVSLSVKAHNAVIHHYRLPYDLKVEYEHYDFSDPEANATDRSLLPDISPLTEAIQRRFSLGAPEEVSAFLETLIHKPLPMGK